MTSFVYDHSKADCYSCYEYQSALATPIKTNSAAIPNGTARIFTRFPRQLVCSLTFGTCLWTEDRMRLPVTDRDSFLPFLALYKCNICTCGL